MDSRIHQLIAAHRLQEDIQAAAAAREAKTAAPRRGWFRTGPTVAAPRRFVRRSQSSIAVDR